MSEAIPTLLWHLVVIFFIGGGVGYFAGVNHARAKTSLELVETYKHLLDYGRATKPVATVTEGPAPVEERVRVQIGETAIGNLTEHLATEAGVSSERARQEAERLVSSFETYGVPPE